jgi:hypothetical protein
MAGSASPTLIMAFSFTNGDKKMSSDNKQAA